MGAFDQLSKRLTDSPAHRARFLGDLSALLERNGVDVNDASVGKMFQVNLGAKAGSLADHRGGEVADTIVITSSHTLGSQADSIVITSSHTLGSQADSIVITSSHTIGDNADTVVITSSHTIGGMEGAPQ